MTIAPFSQTAASSSFAASQQVMETWRSRLTETLPQAVSHHSAILQWLIGDKADRLDEL